jgi:Holliday junction resolvase
MSGGLSPKRKGYEFERSCVNYMREAGLHCRRVPLSGAGEEKGDICITTGWGEVLRCELKRRKCLPEWIVKALGDHRVMIMREDRGDALAVVRLSDLRDWIQCK